MSHQHQQPACKSRLLALRVRLQILLLLSACAAVALAQDQDAGSSSDPQPPGQVHIALAGRDPLTGRATGMAVSWQTQGQTASSAVRFGLRQDTLDRTAFGHSRSYFATYDHHVILAELLPNATYYYQVRGERETRQLTNFTANSSFFLSHVLTPQIA